LIVEVAAKSDVGRVRQENEDSFLVEESVGLYVVADGMGGHVGGKRASSLAVKTLNEYVGRYADKIREGAAVTPIESSPVPRMLAGAVREACAVIFDAAQKSRELQGMGTTVTVLMILNDRAFIGHVGDSRCYLQRGPRIVQLTDDHSLVNEQIKAGLITREQAAVSGLKNIITRSVGFERDVAVDTFALPVQSGDRFLVCSDGLCNLVDDMEMGEALVEHELQVASDSLVDLANRRGGDDNITVLCLKVLEAAG
jgi:protein phosphatase